MEQPFAKHLILCIGIGCAVLVYISIIGRYAHISNELAFNVKCTPNLMLICRKCFKELHSFTSVGIQGRILFQLHNTVEKLGGIKCYLRKRQPFFKAHAAAEYASLIYTFTVYDFSAIIIDKIFGSKLEQIMCSRVLKSVAVISLTCACETGYIDPAFFRLFKRSCHKGLHHSLSLAFGKRRYVSDG